MNRDEFIARLEILLADIPAEEREEALQYYRDYFEDAGPEKESEVVRDLESPERVAETIRGTAGEQSGEFTENGYRNPWEQQKQMPQGQKENEREQTSGYSYRWEEAETKKRGMSMGMKLLVILLILFFLIPVAGPILVAVLAVVLAVLVTVFVFFGALFLFGIAVAVCGIIVVAAGIWTLFGSLSGGMLLCGIGLIALAVGIAASAVTGKLCLVMYPALFRFFVEICRKPFHRKAVS